MLVRNGLATRFGPYTSSSGAFNEKPTRYVRFDITELGQAVWDEMERRRLGKKLERSVTRVIQSAHASKQPTMEVVRPGKVQCSNCG